MKTYKKLITYFTSIPYLLGLLGLVPFIYFSFIDSYFAIFNIEDRLTFIITYAAIILSFLGGIHWGIGMLNRNHADPSIESKLRFFISVIPSILGWVSIFLYEYHAIMLLTLSFLLILLYDFISFRLNNFFQWYLFLRIILTFIVITSLLNIYHDAI